MRKKSKHDVEIVFSCGHKGFAAKALFDEGETVDAPCRDCKPSTWRILIPLIGITIAIVVWLVTL